MQTQRSLLVGVDFGTSGCKAGVIDPDGIELASSRVTTPWRHVATGAEISPHALVETAQAAIGQALDRVRDGRVLAVGVTSMAETGVLIGPDGEAVAPAIAWYDRRGGEEAERIAGELQPREFTARTGLPVGPLCSASKYGWLRTHHEEAEKGRRWLGVAEWIVHRLGGEQAAELSIASRTGWLDLAARGWWEESLAVWNAPRGLLPDPTQAGFPLGEAAHGDPRLSGAVLTVAGHDHLCGAVGAGAMALDALYDSCGSAEAFIAQLTPPVAVERVQRLVTCGITVGWHVIPDRLAVLGALRTGLGLQRFLDLLGVGRDGLADLDDAALRVPAGADGLQVHDLDGEYAALEGISQSPSPGHVWRAALEAAATRAAELVGCMGTEHRRLVVGGGWARSAAFRAVKEAHLGAFHHAAGVAEPGTRGAALLAGLAAGIFESVDEFPAPPSRQNLYH